MRLNRLFYFLAVLLTLPVSGFGQTVPVAPNMLLDIGGALGGVTPTCLKFDIQGNMYVLGKYGNLDAVDFDPSAGVNIALEKLLVILQLNIAQLVPLFG
jgi:hypothetical protein